MRIFPIAACSFAFIIILSNLPSFAQSPKLYGMTEFGGENDHGVIFKYLPDENNLSVVYSFIDSTGSEPHGSLMIANGIMYGLTSFGGSLNYGTLFQFNPDSNTYKMLQDLDDYNLGIFPQGSLTSANNGKLYGFLLEGGQNGVGAIFGFNPANNNYAVVHHMKNSEGSFPNGSLVLADDGNLYGLTQIGGGHNNGTIIRFNPLSNGVTVMYNFENSVSGGQPFGSLIQASDGKLYGLTHTGGVYGNGSLFSFDFYNPTFKVLHDFSPAEGSLGTGDLLEVADGLLYGMTQSGGSIDSGVLFSYDIAADSFEVKFDFNSADGTRPFGSLMKASDGKLYGLTHDGGSNFIGTLFSFDALSSTFTKQLDLDSAQGYRPFYTTLIEYNQIATALPEINFSKGNLSVYPNPTSGSFAIEFRLDKPIDEIAEVSLFNLFGEKIWEREAPLTNGLFNENFSMKSAIPDGIYYVHVNSNEGSCMQKLIYQKF